MPDKYEWGYHSSDAGHVHVALVNDELGRDEIFDVALHGEDGTYSRDPEPFTESLDALKLLLARANGLIEAIGRIQRMRVELNDEWDIPEGDSARDEFIENMDSEDYGRFIEAEATFDRVLDVLQILAHGETPAQGASDG